jgi:nicotinate-nucleotide--dimethylbenzimidazole phosphoribosyltransferase
VLALTFQPFNFSNFNPNTMTISTIPPIDRSLEAQIQAKIEGKTKPPGSLGQLESLAKQAALVQGTLNPQLTSPHLIVFAGDHGIALEGVSPYPPEVTAQMVLNFVRGGAAINVFCRQNGINLKVVDAGVNADFAPDLPIVHQKVAKGTANFLHAPAMSAAQCQQAMEWGASLVRQIQAETHSKVIGFGEMGIGNTSAASLLMSEICGLPLEQCVGRGTGHDDEGLQRKLNTLKAAQEKHHLPAHSAPAFQVLQTFGGFEIAQMCGAMQEAAALGMLILVDGFIASAAFLVAHAMQANVIDYAIFCHRSAEQGHRLMLQYLKAEPLLDLGLRLGEGTAAALAYPLLQNAVAFFNEMAEFSDLGLSS